jgi:hypothetical protein
MFFHRYRISSYDSIRVFLFYFQSESTQCVCILIRMKIKKRIFSLGLGIEKNDFEVRQSHLFLQNL